MSFYDQPPSTQWVAVKFRGEKFAQVWFKPEGEPLALRFRIPQNSFQIANIRKRLTIETLLKAVGIRTEELESCRYGEIFHSDRESSTELKNLLPEPPTEVPHLDIYVCVKPPAEPVAEEESGEPELASPEGAVAEEQGEEPSTEVAAAPEEVREPEKSEPVVTSSEVNPVSAISLAKWQDLEGRWTAILGVESAIESIRLQMDNVRAELEAAWNKTLTPEERLYALKADVAQWTKAKTRVHYAVPKLKEFIHRATWLMGAPERKKLEELFKNHEDEPNTPLPNLDRVPDQLESLLKDRQILSSQGTTVFHECKAVGADIQKYLTRVQTNAAIRANHARKARKGSKFFKDIRKLTGADG